MCESRGDSLRLRPAFQLPSKKFEVGIDLSTVGLGPWLSCRDRDQTAIMDSGDHAGQPRVSQEIKERIAVMQRGVGGITKGDAVTHTLSDGKKIQKVTDVVAGTGSVVRTVSFRHR